MADVFFRHVRMWNTGDLSEFDAVIAAEYPGHVVTGVRDRDGPISGTAVAVERIVSRTVK